MVANSHKSTLFEETLKGGRPFMGSSTLLLFKWKKGAPKIEKNVTIQQYTLSRNYFCQKIVKGGGKVGFSKTP